MATKARALVLGTAGHIDHGKTSLVRALTGVDTDRLPEEKRRGITIELGFAAWTVAPGLVASIVDVPGHEAFVRTMVAGAGGIDAVLLVVSAEDGVMPQTREHLHVCRLLGLRHGVVALTKVDRLGGDPDAVALAEADVRAALGELAPQLAEAPIVPCSALTGEGLPALTAAVRKLAQSLDPRDLRDRPILPVDRVFAVKGHGTVATGTLLAGRIDLARDARFTCIPTGQHRRPSELRARALHVRGVTHEQISAGNRVALNLGNVATDDLARGDIITTGRRVDRTQTLLALLTHLPHDDVTWHSGTTLEVCAGTTHVTARLDPLGPLSDDLSLEAPVDPADLSPGTSIIPPSAAPRKSNPADLSPGTSTTPPRADPPPAASRKSKPADLSRGTPAASTRAAPTGRTGTSSARTSDLSPGTSAPPTSDLSPGTSASPRARASVPPGAAAIVRLRLDLPLPTWHGQRLVLRTTRGGELARRHGHTVGGGLVLDPRPSDGRGQRPRWLALARAVHGASPTDRVLALLRDAGALGITRDELEHRAGVVDLEPILRDISERGLGLALDEQRWLDTAVLPPLATAAVAHVARFQAEHPLQPGLGRSAVAGGLPGRVAPAVTAAAVALAVTRGLLRADGDLLTVPADEPKSDKFPPQVQSVLDLYLAGGITPPTLRDVQDRTGLGERQALESLSALQRAGAIVRVSPDLSLARVHHEALVDQARSHLRSHGVLDVQAFKDLTGLSRKFVVPFLEHLDRLQISRRQGNTRIPGPRL
ncbi:MAG: selenocysteine-specific translation elongation factor [Myxococcales bacterium]|nr:selenocysteine-specific translation elongation factor [Myxococcales bacterium]